jgi:hypothetical protein
MDTRATQCVEVRTTQVGEQLGHLSENIDGLERVVESLCSRLYCVTRNDPQCDKGDDPCAPLPHLVDLASSMRTSSDRLIGLQLRLADVLNRLEL